MSILHPRKGQPYHEINSRRGIDQAARRGMSIDLDVLKTKPDPNCPLPVDHIEHRDGECVGHKVNLHWPSLLLRDGFRDPLGEIRRTARVENLTWPKVDRLRTKDDHKVWLMVDQLEYAAKKKVPVVAEPKSRWGFNVSDWEDLKTVMTRAKGRLRMYALRKHLGDRRFGAKCVAAAEFADVPGQVIH